MELQLSLSLLPIFPLLLPTPPQTGDILVAEDHPVQGAFPWTQQAMGCGHPGEYVYLPYSFIAPSNSSQIGKMISNQWMRLRYGIFEDLDPRHSGLSVTSVHHGQCRGRGVEQVIRAHDDFTHTRSPSNFTIPRFTVTRQAVPKYVIVLENSQAMNMKDHWDFIRTTCKKFIKFDLPNEAHVGLVLFNEAAHIAKPIAMLGPTTDPASRDGLAFSIKNKYNLSPSSGSCIRCGIEKAVEALTTSGSVHGGVLIVISRGGVTSLSLGDEKEVLAKARKHNLQMFSVSIPLPPVTDISLSLERLAHATGGESFFVVDESTGDKSTLATYVGLSDTFREIQERTVGGAPSLVYEQRFQPHPEGVTSEGGNFIIDKFSGGQTQFNVFTLNPYDTYLKKMSLSDRRGNLYNIMMDNMANFHVFSIYNVPFQSEQNIGMNWTYSLERLPSRNGRNRHTVQVTSAARDPRERISIKLWTNLLSHAVDVSIKEPIILFAEVKLGHAPVVDASVVAEIHAINQTGQLIPSFNIPLFDSGNGDPDLRAQDGIYSRYLTTFPGGEGRYTVNLRVHDSHGNAFAPLKTYGNNARACCQDKSYLKVSNQKLGTFSRIVKGDSFRIHSIR
jgi:calcium-activated chloride channel regulator 4